ncbi:zinc finger protein 707-like [Hylaeus anthracinus]|uniref:zinc finger protein 707-like n=1 Tax=Hylaeus anthracinus TaxID=313031 RepID=UPI0023B97C98|nr:zinc finger protein 707-like [Hylaeus anthracinus]
MNSIAFGRLPRLIYERCFWHNPVPDARNVVYLPQVEPMPTEQPRNPRGEAAFKCPDCGRFYMRQSCLKRHLSTECRKTPMFQCKICLGFFTYRHNLMSHMRIHTEGPQYSCGLCQMKFYRRDNLVDHKIKSHNIFPVT